MTRGHGGRGGAAGRAPAPRGGGRSPNRGRGGRGGRARDRRSLVSFVARYVVSASIKCTSSYVVVLVCVDHLSFKSHEDKQPPTMAPHGPPSRMNDVPPTPFASPRLQPSLFLLAYLPRTSDRRMLIVAVQLYRSMVVSSSSSLSYPLFSVLFTCATAS